ncbi:MAG: hypothetical protein Q7K25_06535 [Actinomycetota bacterium]|nr:hypothetical protein [Actinomycetota bacterium]
MTEAPLSVDPQAVGEIVVKALRNGREPVYAPGLLLRLVMAGPKTLPRPVVRKLPR